MTMITRKFKDLIVFLSIIIYCSCINKSSVSQKKEINENCQISIMSPTGCFTHIDLDTNGAGHLTSVRRTISSDTSLGSYDSLISKINFYVKTDTDKVFLKKLIETIKSNPDKNRPISRDNYQFLLYIDRIKKIDVYGDDNDVYSILKILLKYVTYLNEDQCEFLSYFKQSI